MKPIAEIAQLPEAARHSDKRRLRLLAFAVMAAALTAGATPRPAAAQSYTYTTVDPFGASFAEVSGVNASGQIAGYYIDPASGNDYGFLTGAGGTGATTIDPFGSTGVGVSGINNAGQIAGKYVDPVSGNTYGFLTGAGGTNPITIDPFGSTSVVVRGINDAGQVFGDYTDPASGNDYGFLGTPAAVPEASTSASLGLLLALSLGGLVIARRRKSASEMNSFLKGPVRP